MKTRIYFLAAMAALMMGNGANAVAQVSQRMALVAGAATLNNGSVVTLGQPFVGTAQAADGSVSLALGLVPTLGSRTNPPPSFTISPAVSMENGRFMLGFFVEPGRTWIVEGSTNLADWSPVWADMATDPWVEFEDFTAFLYPFRFYRVRLP